MIEITLGSTFPFFSKDSLGHCSSLTLVSRLSFRNGFLNQLESLFLFAAVVGGFASIKNNKYFYLNIYVYI